MSYVFAFAGGKGGIGKSFLTANIGRLLAGTGKSVLLADLDLGGSNLHSFLGISHPVRGLNDLLNNSIKDPTEAAVPCGVPGLHLLSAGDCGMEIANLPFARKQKILTAIKKLPHDYILLDMGAGTGFNTLDFILAAHETVLIFTEEPTAVENGVRLIKSLYLRQARQSLKKSALVPVLEEACRQDSRDSFFPVMNRLTEVDDAENGELRSILSGMKFKILLNQSHNRDRRSTGQILRRLFQRHFLSVFDDLGAISYDDGVQNALIRRRIFVDRFPGHQTSTDLTAVANRLLFTSPAPDKAPGRTYEGKSHYEILDIPPLSSADDIRRAYTDIKSMYTAVPWITDAVFSEPEQAAILKKIDTAFTVLNDAGGKADYDMSRDDTPPPSIMIAPAAPGKGPENGNDSRTAIFGRSVKNDELENLIRLSTATQTAREMAEAMKYRDIITGQELEAYRRACRIEVKTIFEATRVASSTIHNIETDNFEALPPLIYLKNFLNAYAVILGLPAQAVVSGYLRHLRENSPRAD